MLPVAGRSRHGQQVRRVLYLGITVALGAKPVTESRRYGTLGQDLWGGPAVEFLHRLAFVQVHLFRRQRTPLTRHDLRGGGLRNPVGNRQARW